ncbi:MAG: hypothetical protein JWO74_2299 [Solirubrobacterales bacterium]|nr:hypothetical protein [Solirubrobacterales bacterium]
MESIAVFFDWQNAYKGARKAFGLQNQPNEFGNFSPLRLAKILAAGNDRGSDGRLVRVEVHRGLPSSARDPVGYGANRRQAQAWVTEAPELVFPRLRPLRYPADHEESQEPTEKGVDVNLALGAVERVLMNQCDIAILFSHDSDLAPALETICRVVSHNHVETASWRSSSFQGRIPKTRGVFNHAVGWEAFQRVATPVNYARQGSKA